MALSGTIDPFVPGSNFESYEDRMEQYFIANEIKEDKQTSWFITLAGEAMYEILKPLTHPVKPSEKSYKEILKLLRKHFTPQSNKRAERYKFNQVMQESGEQISEFIVRLKSLAQTCKFGDFLDNEKGEAVGGYKLKILDEALTDRFIVGLNNEKIKSNLLSEEKLDFEQCCAKALQMEMVQKESKSLQTTSIKAITKAVQKPSWKYNHKDQNRKNFSRSKSQGHQMGQCRRCGRYHDEKTCPAIKWKCYACNKTGHVSTMCRNKSQNNSQSVDQNRQSQQFHSNRPNNVKTIRYEDDDNRDSGNMINNVWSEVTVKESRTDELNVSLEPEEERWVEKELEEEARFVKTIKRNRSRALDYELEVESKKVIMECDCGAVVSVMSLIEYEEKFSHIPLKPIANELPLRSVTGEKLIEVGSVEVHVKFMGKAATVELKIIDISRPFMALFGRNWLDVFIPNWREKLSTQIDECINSVSQDQSIIKEIKQKFPNVVSTDMDKPIEGFTAELVMKENAQPVFHCAYTVPYKLKDRVSEEIDRLVSLKILKPIKHSEWASPLVVRVKSNGELRFCIDGKVTINKFLETDHHPLHRIDDIFASLSNCLFFCVIDLKGAFKQLELSINSQKYVVINTHKGLYVCTRMFDGLKVAPAIFQSIMDQILVALEKVRSFIDDIIIGGKTIEECKSRLLEVLARLDKYNVRINLSKCKFFQTKVEYLGHVLEGNNIYPNPEKVRAIIEAPIPKNVQQLQSYLGLLNYYCRFVPNLSSEIHELYKLLRNDADFVWAEKCQRSFEKSKQLLTSNQVLELYDPDKEIVVSADASPYGVGAVLSHVVNGEEKPVLFASSSLSPAEKNYSQPQREALAIIFAVKKFYKYIYGKKFTIISDAQSLRDLFNPKKGISPVAAARLQRWAIYLSMYDYEIKHRSGSKMGHVDALSRLPLEDGTEVEVDKINFINFGEDIPIESKDIEEGTQADSILSKVYEFVLTGWPSKISPCMTPYFLKRNSLSIESNCVYYINRVIIPEVFRKSILETLHECHTGIVRMKMMARKYVWWPLIDKDIEKYVSECLPCQQVQPVSKRSTTASWKPTLVPFERVHLDFAKHAGKEFLVISDAFSKFCDVKLMTCTKLFKLEEMLSDFFLIFGLPTQLVTDNGPPFNAHGFEKFCQRHGIKLTHSPPYHPPSNGQAENAVKTVKQCFFKFLLGAESGLPIQRKLQKFLMYHNNSPSTVTGKTPYEMIFSFKPKTLLDLVNLKHKDEVDKFGVNVVSSGRNFQSKFSVDQNVLYKNHFKNFVNWMPAKVLQVVSRFTYLVRVCESVRFVHEDQLRISNLSKLIHEPRPHVKVKNAVVVEGAEKVKSDVPVVEREMHSEVNVKQSSVVVSENEKRTRSGRMIVKPDRYGIL